MNPEEIPQKEGRVSVCESVVKRFFVTAPTREAARTLLEAMDWNKPDEEESAECYVDRVDPRDNYEKGA